MKIILICFLFIIGMVIGIMIGKSSSKNLDIHSGFIPKLERHDNTSSGDVIKKVTSYEGSPLFKVYYDSCISRYQGVPLQGDNNTGLQLWAHPYVFILQSLHANDIENGNADGVNQYGFLGYKFYQSYYAKKASDTAHQDALKYIETFREAFSNKQKIGTNPDNFIELFYNQYINSKFITKNDFPGYFEYTMNNCTQNLKECNSLLKNTNFMNELLFFHYYFQNQKPKDIPEQCNIITNKILEIGGES